MKLEIELDDALLVFMHQLFPKREHKAIVECAAAYDLLIEQMEPEFASLVAGAALCALFRQNPDILYEDKVRTMIDLILMTSSHPSTAIEVDA